MQIPPNYDNILRQMEGRNNMKLRVINGANNNIFNTHYVIKNFTINEGSYKMVKGVYADNGRPLILDEEGNIEFIALDQENFLTKEKEVEKTHRTGFNKVIGYNYTHYSYKEGFLCPHKKWYYSTERHYSLDPLLNRKETIVVSDKEGLLYLYNYKTTQIISNAFTELSNNYLSAQNLIQTHNIIHFLVHISFIEDTTISRKLSGFVTLHGQILKEAFDDNGNIYEIENNNLNPIFHIIYKELEEEAKQKLEKNTKKILARQRSLELLEEYKNN